MNNINITLNNITLSQLLSVTAALVEHSFNTTTHSCDGQCETSEAPKVDAGISASVEEGPSTVKLTPVGVILEFLSDPRFELRTASALVTALDAAFPDDAFGSFCEEDMLSYLTFNGIAYYTKTRRRDGAMLIGLHKAPVEATPAAEAVAIPTIPEGKTKFAKLMELLEDRRYTWRTVATLVEKTGYANKDEVLAELEDNGVSIEFANRNSDGAEMIGLSSRV